MGSWAVKCDCHALPDLRTTITGDGALHVCTPCRCMRRHARRMSCRAPAGAVRMGVCTTRFACAPARLQRRDFALCLSRLGSVWSHKGTPGAGPNERPDWGKKEQQPPIGSNGSVLAGSSPCCFLLLPSFCLPSARGRAVRVQHPRHRAPGGEGKGKGRLWDFGSATVVKNESSTQQNTSETSLQCEAAPSGSLQPALSALCAWIRVFWDVLLGQKDKKRQFALVKLGMAAFNGHHRASPNTAGADQSASPVSHCVSMLARKEKFVLLCNAEG